MHVSLLMMYFMLHLQTEKYKNLIKLLVNLAHNEIKS